VLSKYSCLPDTRKLRQLISSLCAYLPSMLMAARYESRMRATVNRWNIIAHPFKKNLVVSRRKAEKESHHITPTLQHETYKCILDRLQGCSGHYVLNSDNP